MFSRRIIALVLSLSVLIGFAMPALGAPPGEPPDDAAAPAAPPAAAPAAPPAAAPGAEIVERRTASSKTFATDAPGRFKTKVYNGAVHFKDPSGRWADVDMDFVEGRPGRLKNKASAISLDLAKKSTDSELARVELDKGHSVAFGLEGALPTDAAVSKNDAVYPGILPSVDLRLSGRNGGLKEDIVLTSPSAQNVFYFPMSLVGLAASLDAGGAIEYRDEAGAVRLRTPAGYMEDANVDPETGDGARSEGVEFELVERAGGTALKVTADRAWLDAPERVYPVTVDPSYWNSTTWSDDTFVMSPFHQHYEGDPELKVGSWNGGSNKAISFMHYDVNGLNGKNIESAVFHVYENHAFSCQARGMGVYRITQGWGVMWDYPGASTGERVGWGAFAMGYEPGGCGDGWASFGNDQNNSMTQTVRNWTSGAWGQFGLAMKVDPGSENDSYAWKTFYSWNACGGGWCVPHIDINWSEYNRDPFGSIDSVSSPAREQIRVGGWAIDPDTTGPIDMHIYVNGQWGGAVTANGYRPDVGNAYPGYGNYHGYDYTFGWGSGTHSVCLYAINYPSGNNPNFGCRSVYVAPITPPSAPTNVQASAGIASANVSWTLSSDNGGAAIDSYLVKAYYSNGTYSGVSKTVNCNCGSTTVTGLADGTSYFFGVQAHNSRGYSGSTNSNAITTPARPSTPTGVTATAGYASGTVSWTAPADNGRPITSYAITAYNTTNSTTSSASCTDCLSTRQYTFNGLVPGHSYYFRVAAVNDVGTSNYSANSNTIVAQPTATLAPTNVRATRGDRQAFVQWDPPDLAVSGRTTYDVITYRASDNFRLGSVSAGTATSKTVTGLTNGVAVYFKVTSTNTVVTSPESAPSNTVTPAGAPFAPTGVSAARGDQSATVSWTGVDNNGDAITSFTVSVFKASDNTLLKTQSASAGPVVVTALVNGTGYYFKVRATNTVGTGPESAATNTVVPAGRPFPPTGVNATPGDTTATVRWSAANGNGAPVTSYRVTASPGGAVQTVTGLQATFTGLTNGTTYTFTVVAINEVGQSDPSAPSAGVVPSGKPGAPQNVIAVDGQGDDPSVSWAPADPNGSAIRSYTVIVYHGAKGSGAPDERNRQTVGPSSRQYIVPDAVDGMEYSFVIFATNANGNGPLSGRSNTVTEVNVPAPPAITSITGPSGGQATVQWSEPPARAKAAAVTGYRVMAFSASGGPTQVANAGASDRSATVTGLTAGPYVFWVVATSIVGDSQPSTSVGTGGIAAPKYAALGDSYQSGEGVTEFEPVSEQNACRRSEKKAYAKFARESVGSFNLVFPACSGAKMPHVNSEAQIKDGPYPETQNGQISAVPTDANVITIGIGGNDAGFSNVLFGCADDPRGPDCDNPETERKIDALEPDLKQTYLNLRAKAPNAAVFVVNYPIMFKKDATCASVELFDEHDDWLIGRTQQLNDVIDRAALAAGVTVIDVEGALAGHELCTADEWIWGLTLSNRTSQFHPKAQGQFAMSKKVEAAIALRRPTVTSVSPNSGVDSRSVCSGRDTITIRGTNFAPGATVKFGSLNATSVTYVSPTELRAVAPKQAASTVAVQVWTNRGLNWGVSAATSASQFTYRADTIAPVTSSSLSPAPNANGWNRQNTTVSLSATDATCVGDVVSITYSASPSPSSGGQTIPSTTVSGSTASFVISSEGETTVTYRATDSSGNVEAAKTVVVRIDKTGPLTTVNPPSPPVIVSGTAITGSATDNLSGIDSTSVTFTDPTGANSPVTRQAGCTSGCGTRASQWSVSTDGLHGVYEVTARSIDRAGNQGLSSPPLTVTIV